MAKSDTQIAGTAAAIAILEGKGFELDKDDKTVIISIPKGASEEEAQKLLNAKLEELGMRRLAVVIDEPRNKGGRPPKDQPKTEGE